MIESSWEEHGQTIRIAQDKLWIPSVEELNGSFANMVLGQGKAYPIFSDDISRVKYFNEASKFISNINAI